MKKTFLFICSFIIMVSCFVFGIITVTAEEKYDFAGGEIEVQYHKHEMFKVPDASFGSVKANYVTVTPSGQRITDYYFKLTEGGIYQIEYSAVVDGKSKTHKVDFVVETPAYSVEKMESLAYYGQDDKYNSGNEGIIVSLADGDVFHYNKVINVWESSKTLPAIDFGYLPETLNQVDASNMYITFTDIYDENNKVTCWFKIKANNLDYMYMFSKATNQVWGGYENRGASLTYHKNNQYGTPIDLKAGYYGTPADDSYQKHFGLYFNAEENSIRINNELGYGQWHKKDIQNYFGDPGLQEHPWNGFTTGEVYMDIWFEGYFANKASIVINSILDEDITQNEFKDDVAPEIIVSEDFDTSINAMKGYYYPVNSAVAKDKMSGGVVDCSVDVYYNYSRPSGVYSDFNATYASQVEIDNGRFKTDKLGYYAICYRAKDWYGNMTEKVVSVKVVEPNVINPVTGLTLTGIVEDAVVGGVCYLAEGANAVGGIGSILYGYDVSLGQTKYEVQYDYANRPYFVPNQAGEYIVKIYAEDSLGVRCEQQYTVGVVSTGEIIKDVPVLPIGIISGCTYDLPTVNVYDTNGNVVDAAKIKIIDGDGERAYSRDETFTPDKDGNAKIVYYCDGVENIYTVPVLTVFNDLYEIAVKDYFIFSEGMSASMSVDGTEFIAQADSTATFPIAQVSKSLKMDFASNPDKANFGEFVITLMDSADYSISISLGLVNNGAGRCNISLNGEMTNTRTNVFNFASQNTCSISYDNNTRSFVCDDRTMVFDKTLYGEHFDGFTSGKVYIKFEMKGVEEESGVMLTMINDQMLNTDTAVDNGEPIIAIENTYDLLVVEYGSTFTIYKALVADVLDPTVRGTVSLTFNNNPVTSKDNVIMKSVSCDREYEVELDQYGTYTLRYQSVDSNGNEKRESRLIQVIDGEAPVIKVSNVPVELSLGENKVPKATATDNVTEEPTIWICIYDPAGNIIYAKDGKFTAVHSGIYKVIYYAIDENGNSAEKVYFIAID